jgi:hypothetical protein
MGNTKKAYTLLLRTSLEKGCLFENRKRDGGLLMHRKVVRRVGSYWLKIIYNEGALVLPVLKIGVL